MLCRSVVALPVAISASTAKGSAHFGKAKTLTQSLTS
jgi:hypothetical protein